MKVVVTGAGGLIGRAIVRELIAAKHEVTASDRPGVDLSFAAGARTAGVELLDPSATRTLIEGHQAVIHSAGLFDLGAEREALEAANVKSVAHVLGAAGAAKIERVVHLSTVGVYGLPEKNPCPETEPPRPKNDYERTKALGESIARDAMGSLGVTILRPSLVYGPYSRYGFGVFIGGIVLRLSKGQTRMRFFRSSPSLSAVHVDDVARAAVYVLEHPETRGQIYNICDDTPMTITATLKVIGDALGMEIDAALPYLPWLYKNALTFADKMLSPHATDGVNHGIERRWRRLADEIGFEAAFIPKLDRDWITYASGDHVYDNKKLERLGFSYSYPNLAKGLDETVRWYIDHRWIPEPRKVLEWARAREQRKTADSQRPHRP